MNIILRSIIIYINSFIITNVLRKKQIQHLTMYDYVIGITIGSLAVGSMINTDLPIINGILSLLLFGMVGYFVSYITYKNHKVQN